ncbi:hypothetical protein MNV49_003346 [Pseudohyphozyma bogoriensis]|nr:hypothetical protein MNV49_003346 [Pseudohyphozyma bogoriensis]
MMLQALGLALVGAVAALPSGPAAFESNHVYRSPSRQVDALRVETAQIFEGLGKRWTDTYTGNVTFPYGVASGDPYDDSVILWTMPRKLDLGGLYGGNAWPPICLHWIVSATNTDFSVDNSVQNGFVQTTEDVRYAVKVEATGLKPYTKYYYRFESCEGADLGVSPVGHFKTLPAPDDEATKIRLAVFSCSNLPFGFFNAYGNAANHSDTLDYVQHVGDYIYEYKNGDYGDGTAIGRVPQPDREITSLQDYRDRYAQYRTDPDLQELHRTLAWQAVWDDHEVADNTWAKGSADSNDTLQGQVGDYQFSERKAKAVRAYYEWMPIRQVDTDDKLRIWRNFKIGKLADMIMLESKTDLYYNTDEIIAVADSPDRSMTGSKQQQWFFDRMDESSERGATWRLVMQQVVFSRVNYSIATGGSTEFNVDAWEGYRYQRDKILEHIESNKINNTVILSGDSHATWISDLKRENQTYDPVTGAGALGVEFAGTAVSSPSSYGHGPGYTEAVYRGIAANLTEASPSLQYAEGQLRGYFELTITPEEVTCDVFGFYEQETRNTNVTHVASFSTKKDSNKLTRPLNNGTVPVYGALGAGKSA